MRTGAIRFVALICCLPLVGCGDSVRSRPTPSPTRTAPAIVHVHAVLESTHLDRRGVMRTIHAPLVGYRVLAATGSAKRRSARLDSTGLATLRVPRGTYVLTVSLRNACHPRTVVATGDSTVTLSCIAP